MSRTGTVQAIARHAASRAPMEPLDAVAVSAEAGLDGDFRGRSRRRQVTLIAAEDWQAACAELGVTLDWTLRRANLLVAGLALPREAGTVVRVGGVTLAVTGQTEPCARMDEQHAGLRAALTPDWRGGITCRVVAGGAIEVGDVVSVDGSGA